MSVVEDKLTKRDIATLSKMHIDSLPDSIISGFGDRYARAFYRFLANSSKEMVFVERDPELGNSIIAACVLSLQSATLKRRLLWRPAWFPVVVLSSYRLLIKFGSNRASEDAGVMQPEGPEIVLIFTCPELRSRGCGSRLVKRAEQWLTHRQAKTLYVKTQEADDNRAIAFYLRMGFSIIGSVSAHGKQLSLLQKRLVGNELIR